MSPTRPDDFDFDQLLAYHLDALSEDEMRAMEATLAKDESLKEAAESLKNTLAPLNEYEVDIPVGLAQKIQFTVRAQTITVDSLLNDFTAPAPVRKRHIIGRVADFIATAAAVLLISSAVLLSTGHARQQARKALCAGNLCSLGSSLGVYANDYDHQLPYAQIGSNTPWYDSASKQPRRSNLFILIKHNYTSPTFFICPEEQSRPLMVKNFSQFKDFPTGTIVSYSFQNLNGDRRFTRHQLQQRWELAQRMPIMADRTPLIRQNQLASELMSDKTISPNHASIGGQNILVLDGRVTWQGTPVFGPQRDNIWKAGQIQQYNGRETPADPTDCFLAP